MDGDEPVGIGEGLANEASGESDAIWSAITDDHKTRMHQSASGWKAAGILLFAGFLILVSTWYSWVGAPAISAPIGITVFCAVALGLLAFAFGPNLLEKLGGRAAALSLVGRLFYPPVLVVAWMDRALRRWIAGACGLGLHGWLPRYALLFLHVGIGAALLWIVPRFWPAGGWLGYIGLAWAILVLVAVVRQWFWIEHQYERQATGLNHTAIIKLPDLRDEALFSVLLFFLSVPAILWKLDSSFDLFTSESGAASWIDWIAFFGAELTKAVPLVDWAEIYGAGTATAISPIEPYGLYVLFGMRVLLDLVLLGALIYAFERVGQIARQWREFIAGDRKLVDPSLEHRIFRLMRRASKQLGRSWFEAVPVADLGPFKFYNANRLLTLAQDEEAENAAIAAHAAHQQSPQYAFLPIARSTLFEEKRRKLNQRLSLLLVELLGRVNNSASREMLDELLVDFEGRDAETTWRVRSAAALAMSAQWLERPEEQRSRQLQSDVVASLRNGLRRNLKRSGNTRSAIGDQLSAIGGGAALSTLADHLANENSAVVLKNIAYDMEQMANKAPAKQLKRAADFARRRASRIERQRQQNQADRDALNALTRAANVLEAAGVDAEQSD